MIRTLPLIALSILLCAPAIQCAVTSAVPSRIELFDGDIFAGSLVITYNGQHIDQAQLLDADGDIALMAEPGVVSDTLFTCRWRWRGGGFSGTWRSRENGAEYLFEGDAPIRRIVTIHDSSARVQQAVFEMTDDTLELTGFSHDEAGRLLGCVGLVDGEYAGRVEWRYDATHRLSTLFWVAAQETERWRAEVIYSRAGEISPGVWNELDKSLWLPLPVFTERLGL